MSQRFKIGTMFAVAGVSAGAGAALAANERLELGLILLLAAFLCAWHALHLLTAETH